MANVRDAEGARVSALLTLTTEDYLVPLTTQGQLGLFAAAYFREPGCSGQEYLSPAADNSALAPAGGVVYQSLNSGAARYVPRFAAADMFITTSRLYFDAANNRVCEDTKGSLPLLQTYENDPAITGFDMERDTGRTLAITTPAPRERAGLLSTAPGNTAPEPLPFEQQECSPGCTMGDIGNNFCDISCYVGACSFDGGDCDSETPEFLQEEQAKFCSPGCTFEDIGDGFCDTNCDNNACDFDGGDCDASR